jgi:hypothetical protein
VKHNLILDFSKYTRFLPVFSCVGEEDDPWGSKVVTKGDEDIIGILLLTSFFLTVGEAQLDPWL